MEQKQLRLAATFSEVCACACVRVCRITEIRNRTTQITEDIRQLEQDSEDAQGKAGHDLYLMFVRHCATCNPH